MPYDPTTPTFGLTLMGGDVFLQHKGSLDHLQVIPPTDQPSSPAKSTKPFPYTKSLCNKPNLHHDTESLYESPLSRTSRLKMEQALSSSLPSATKDVLLRSARLTLPEEDSKGKTRTNEFCNFADIRAMREKKQTVQMGPREKYKSPITSSQEIGWFASGSTDRAVFQEEATQHFEQVFLGMKSTVREQLRDHGNNKTNNRRYHFPTCPSDVVKYREEMIKNDKLM